jgi:hypothetical protein
MYENYLKTLEVSKKITVTATAVREPKASANKKYLTIIKKVARRRCAARRRRRRARET